MSSRSGAEPAKEPKEPPSKTTLAGVLALLASLGGNIAQWQRNEAEVLEARARTTALDHEQKENATKSVQTWIDQLQKFNNVEDRVMVLSAAMSTTPYPEVKQWASEQMLRLEGELKQRKEQASEQLAVVEHVRPAPGLDLDALAGLGHGKHLPKPDAPKPAQAEPTPPAAGAAPTAEKQALDRVNLAVSLLDAAKAEAKAPDEQAPHAEATTGAVPHP